MATALVALLVAAIAFVAISSSDVASAACGELLQPPCPTTTAPEPTSTAPSTSEVPTTEAPPTTPVPVTTAAKPVATTAAPSAAPTTQQSRASATTLAPTTTSNPLIVAGPDPAAGEGPTVPGDTVAATKAKNEDKTGTVVALVIAGLLVVAILLSLLTYRFWRNTRPLVVHPEAADDADAAVARRSPATAEVPLARR